MPIVVIVVVEREEREKVQRFVTLHSPTEIPEAKINEIPSW